MTDKTQDTVTLSINSLIRILNRGDDDVLYDEVDYSGTWRAAAQELPDNYEFWLKAVKQNGYLLQRVSKHLMTPEMCKIAVQEEWGAMILVPEHLKTAELCLAAVKTHGWTLRFVPEHLKTVELCLIAVKNCASASKFVPEHLRDEIESRLKEQKND